MQSTSTYQERHPVHPPSTQERDESERKLHELEARIKELEKELEPLRYNRDSLKSWLAPIRRLPSEIICEIAVHSVQLGVSPVMLCSISRQIRDAAVKMASLWTSLYFRAQRVSKLDSGYIWCNDSTWLRLLLHRSGSLPLKINIEGSLDRFTNLSMNSQPGLRRIETLTLQLSISNEFWPSNIDLLRLKRLSLVVTPSSDAPATGLLDIIEASGNKSFDLLVAGWIYTVYHLLQHPIVGQLTVINLRIGILGDVPILPPIILPKVKELKIIVGSRFLQFLLLPNLESLALGNENRRGDETVEISNLSPSMKKLILDSVILVHSGSQLQILPNLLHLEFHNTCGSITPLSNLQMPKLETLILDTAHASSPVSYRCKCQEICSPSTGFLNGSSPRKIIICNTPIPEACGEGIRAQTGLKILQLKNCKLSAGFMRHLLSKRGQGELDTEDSLEVRLTGCGDYDREKIMEDFRANQPPVRIIFES